MSHVFVTDEHFRLRFYILQDFKYNSNLLLIDIDLHGLEVFFRVFDVITGFEKSLIFFYSQSKFNFT